MSLVLIELDTKLRGQKKVSLKRILGYWEVSVDFKMFVSNLSALHCTNISRVGCYNLITPLTLANCINIVS